MGGIDFIEKEGGGLSIAIFLLSRYAMMMCSCACVRACVCVEMGDAVEVRVCGGYAHHKRAYTHPSLSSKRKVVNLRPTSARCLPGEGGFGFMHFSARIDPSLPHVRSAVQPVEL